MAKKNKAFKFRLYPTEKQLTLLKKTFGCVRFVYNKMLNDRIENYEQFKENKDELLKHKHPTPAKYKKEYPFLKEVDSLSLANAQMNLDKAYKSFFKKNAKFPKFKSRKHKQTYTTNVVNGNIEILEGHIKLPKMRWVKLKQHREIPVTHQLKSVTISMTSSGKVYASVLTEFEETVEKVEPKNVVGLDFSMTDLYVTSDGERANYPRFYRQSLEKLAKEQRVLSRRKKGSNRWYKQKKKITKLQEKTANQRRDFLHKKSYALANNYDAVVVEDLNMKGMSKALKFGKSVLDNGWGMFTTFLKYKFEDRGKAFIKINKWFPSSKTCSRCGEVKEQLSLSERIYKCSCGHEADRDENAAKNIENEGKRLLSETK
ncbi:IS200/IS605 family element transposase accessory protein TnpB [Anaerobacillus sp. CMMVII]|uniref:transposase n=1 Tax=Anaerobacillus sp. CMMVII TaxID=2755588 RepID=UPI0021B7D44F|nr:transposase [Anaerobacillus sp. CMMVII]MCT8138391.1 IS200/IS605 family element transposase accessory protein TnpB [Anaerobacillus sp. CMMVII]